MLDIILGLLFALILGLSLVGWGKLVARATFGAVQGDWPFHAGWGTCLVALLGGLASLLGLISVPFNVALVMVGLGLFFGLSDRRKLFSLRPWFAANSWERFVFAMFALLAVAIVFWSLRPTHWNAADDSIAYAAFPKKMLDTGRLMEPFSMRRITGFGGYAFLHSLVLTVLTPSALNVVDQGIMTVFGGAAIAYYVHRRLRGSWLVACAVGIAFMLWPAGRINLSPTAIMSFMAIVLLETVQMTLEAAELSVLKRAGLLALVSAGFLSLRSNILPFEGALVLLLFIVGAPSIFTLDRARKRIAFLALTGLFAGILILPWALSLDRSSGTPFFPLVHGNWTGTVPNSGPLSITGMLSVLGQNVWFSQLYVLLVATVFGMAIGAVPRQVVCLAAAALLTAAATVLAMTLYCAFDLWRYYSPLTKPVALFVGAALLIHFTSLPSFRPRLFHTVGALALCLIAVAKPAGSLAKRLTHPAGLRENVASQDAPQLHGRLANYEEAVSCAASYQAALDSIPKGAKVLAEVDAPFLLNYRDHEIVNIDAIGAVSPPPGLPTQGGAPELAAYLSQLSIGYLMYVKPEDSLATYRRDLWQRPEMQTDPIMRLYGRCFLWFFDAVEELAKTCPKTFENNRVVVLSLAAAGNMSPAKTTSAAQAPAAEPINAL